MKSVKKIDLPKWLLTPELSELVATLDADKNAQSALLVGGCVRNVLLKTSATDVDIATIYAPDKVTKALEKNNIRVIPTGIEHGTVTALINDVSFEITTLRKDVTTDGRYAQVVYTDDWAEDAQRRDFTMNALYADLGGNIFDPLSLGISDLQAKRVAFVGDPDARIAEDYLRILRFFRFWAWYGKGAPDQTALEACSKNAHKIKELSRERITYEFLKILEADHAADVLATMFGCGVLNDIAESKYDQSFLNNITELQQKYDSCNILTRLFVVSGARAKFHDDYLRLSHVQKKFLVKLESLNAFDFSSGDREIKKLIYYHGNDLVMQVYLVALALNKIDVKDGILDVVKNWKAPECPITGEMLLAEGYQTGPELGQELERRKEEWLEDNL